jgi:hypothetical protein
VTGKPVRRRRCKASASVPEPHPLVVAAPAEDDILRVDDPGHVVSITASSRSVRILSGASATPSRANNSDTMILRMLTTYIPRRAYRADGATGMSGSRAVGDGDCLNLDQLAGIAEDRDA